MRNTKSTWPARNLIHKDMKKEKSIKYFWFISPTDVYIVTDKGKLLTIPWNSEILSLRLFCAHKTEGCIFLEEFIHWNCWPVLFLFPGLLETVPSHQLHPFAGGKSHSKSVFISDGGSLKTIVMGLTYHIESFVRLSTPSGCLYSNSPVTQL